MSCRLTDQVVAALGADRLEPDGMLARHAVDCDDCARALVAAQLDALGHREAAPGGDDAVLAALGLGPMPAAVDPLDRDFLRALAETVDGILPAPPAALAPATPVPGGPAPIADRPSALSRPMAMIPPEEMLDLPVAPTPAVRAPRPATLRSTRRYWPALLAGGGALAAALLILVVLPMARPGDLPEAAPEATKLAVQAPAAVRPDPPVADVDPGLGEGGDDEAEAADDAGGAAVEADAGAAEKAAAAPSRARRSRRAKPAPAAAAPKPSARPASPKPAAPRPAARKKEESTSEVDDLLGALDGSGGGSKGGGARAAPAEAPTGDPMLPEKLTKRQILTVVKRNARAVRTCKEGTDAAGTVPVEIVIGRAGRVTSATVKSGPYKGTPVGSCVERTVRAFRFPQFSGDPMRIVMPFAL